MVFIGVDPGISGGIAFIRDGHVSAIKMPETERDLLNVLVLNRSYGDPFAMLERVSATPQMGVVSAFKFGKGLGMLRMALVAAGIPFDEVGAAKWQGHLGCRSGGDKNVTKRRAQELFPKIKVTHAIADALLLAEYGRRLKSGEVVALASEPSSAPGQHRLTRRRTSAF